MDPIRKMRVFTGITLFLFIQWGWYLLFYKGQINDNEVEFKDERYTVSSPVVYKKHFSIYHL